MNKNTEKIQQKIKMEKIKLEIIVQKITITKIKKKQFCMGLITVQREQKKNKNKDILIEVI